MKIKFRNSTRANILLVCLLSTSVIGTVLTSYLRMVSTQNTMMMRSLGWNTTMPIVEAGLEEALAHLDKHPISADWATDGWNLQNGFFKKTGNLDVGYYEVEISNSVPPIITSTGYYPVGSSNDHLSRSVQLTTQRDGLFTKSIATKGLIDVNGHSIEIDSFDSADTNFSTGGLYDSNKAKDGGDVATNLDLVNSVVVGNAEIYGKISTGPGGSIDVGANGSVGSSGWHAAGHHGIENGWSSDDMNVYFPDAEIPYNSAITPSNAVVNGVYYQYFLSTGNYLLSSLNLDSDDKLLVTGNAVLYVTGNVTIEDDAFVQIEVNASLELYIGGANADIGGNGIVNLDGNAENFLLFGLPSNTTLNITFSANFTGTLYAPQAAFTLGNGSANVYEFVGAIVSSTITINGNYNFHYDENLASIDQYRGYVITSWNEIYDVLPST